MTFYSEPKLFKDISMIIRIRADARNNSFRSDFKFMEWKKLSFYRSLKVIRSKVCAKKTLKQLLNIFNTFIQVDFWYKISQVYLKQLGQIYFLSKCAKSYVKCNYDEPTMTIKDQISGCSFRYFTTVTHLFHHIVLYEIGISKAPPW